MARRETTVGGAGTSFLHRPPASAAAGDHPGAAAGPWATARGWLGAPWMRYLLVGGSSFVLNVVLLNIFKEGFGWSIETSALLAFWGTFGYSYAMQRGVVFRSGAGWVCSMVLYGLLVLFNSLAITVVVSASHRAGLGLATSQFIGTAMVTCWNYFAYKHILFRTPSTPAGGATDEQ